MASIASRSYASHGPPSFNEPSGWLFGEQVSLISLYTPFHHFVDLEIAGFIRSANRCSFLPSSLERPGRRENEKTGRRFGMLVCTVHLPLVRQSSTFDPTQGTFSIVYDPVAHN